MWTWELNNQSYIVGPTDIISVTGTIYNDPTSSVTLQGLDQFIDNSSIGGFDTPKIGDIYESTEISGIYYSDSGPLGSVTLQSQFQGVVISPGSSYTFELFNLIPGVGPTSFDPTPKSIPAPIGTYRSSSVALSIDGFGEGSGPGFYSGGSLEITVVPLPSALLLFASGVLGIIFGPKWRVLTMASSRRR
ncbi:MAG TPA: hypothetical protein ENJ80_15595 [Gammaproteobacteria bacterium]|nr:hypothetical protein [Gammaproteobacteria bacterium]